MKAPNITLITLSALALTACGGQSDSPLPNVADPAATDIQSTPDRDPRIVGGTEVSGNKYPWMVAVMSRNSDPSQGQFCGGSLIASQWILTAAHCIESETADGVSVLLGQPDLNQSGGQTIKVSRIIEHPDYQRQGYPDLALLQLDRKTSVLPILMPSRNNPVPDVGEEATVTGWGQISENGPATTELRESTMPIVGHNQCNRAYDGQIVEDAMVCAGTTSGDKDSCYGDSGGPLFVPRGESYVQAGVVSFGEECGLANVPGVYARVSSYGDWISGYADVTFYQGTSTPARPPTPDTETPDTETPEPEAPAPETPDEETPVTEKSIKLVCENLECTMTAKKFGAGDYYWDFGDGWGDEGRKVTHQYDTAGEYTIIIGHVSKQGDYTEITKTHVVTDDNYSGANQDLPEFSGRLKGWGDQADLPSGQQTILMPAGTLNATLTVPKKRRFVIYLDRYDAQSDEWVEIAEVQSKRGTANISLPIEAGEYGFTVMSLGRGGKYNLVTTVD